MGISVISCKSSKNPIFHSSRDSRRTQVCLSFVRCPLCGWNQTKRQRNRATTGSLRTTSCYGLIWASTKSHSNDVLLQKTTEKLLRTVGSLPSLFNLTICWSKNPTMKCHDNFLSAFVNWNICKWRRLRKHVQEKSQKVLWCHNFLFFSSRVAIALHGTGSTCRSFCFLWLPFMEHRLWKHKLFCFSRSGLRLLFKARWKTSLFAYFLQQVFR